MFNRLTYPKKMAEFLSDNNINVILLDNNSTYQPLLDWYDKCPYKVYRFNENLGHKCLYKSGILSEYKDQHYILTDHDLDISEIPNDFLEVLMTGLNSLNVVKSGLSLEVQDLPDNEYAKKAYDWEINYWKRPIDHNGFYVAEIDTTFAVYDRNREYTGFPDGDNFFKAVRSPRPYTARHLPWYNTIENITDEEMYYIKSTNTYWLGHFKEFHNIKGNR